MSQTNGADERARELHDRTTRGIVLSAVEQAELEAWYARQDQNETITLGLSATGPSPVPLQVRVEEAVAQLRAVTERIQELTTENDTLRREVAALQRQLAQPPIARAE